MPAVLSIFEGCYDAARAAALAGVPQRTVYDWARKDLVTPSISRSRPKLWSYADLMELRIVYWLRHPKDGGEAEIPPSTMAEVRRALSSVRQAGVDLWSYGDSGELVSPVVVDRSGRIKLDFDGSLWDTQGQGIAGIDFIDVLGPFGSPEGDGPDLRRPRPHLRIVPGKLSGEPHLARSRLTTQAVAALARRGYSATAIRKLYPDQDATAIAEAIDLESQLLAA